MFVSFGYETQFLFDESFGCIYDTIMQPPRIVIDTNVLISALRSRDGYAFRLLEQLGKGNFSVHLSVPLLMEYEEVLNRELPNLPVSQMVIDDVLDYLCDVAEVHEIFFLWRPFLRDPDDDMVLEVAVKAACQYIVTFNRRDFTGVEQFSLEVVTPGEFLKRIGS
ncbi:MAG: putative toxin-antitoxin system toxin component, PIN family [Caldilineaceae bacterium]|nr:putative toxin-antitoxin system toxin component, PIN family [Caldilineaceae bacterium]MCB0126418.1 putative toxin-antitoxin system toxin component, PIN family [Caldilineaceae bacterium]